jgi:Zn-dependent protease
MTETLQYALIVIPSVVIAIVFHEVAHGWAALALGDPTAREQRRLTLNPIRHVDPVGTIVVPGFLAMVGAPVFGWARPVPVNAARLDHPRAGMMAVAAAGPASNFLMALLGAAALGIASALGEPSAIVTQGLFSFILINLFIGLFNLLPIPPFDGSHIVEGALPRRWAVAYEKLRPYGMLLFFGLIAIAWAFPGLDVIQRLIGPPLEWTLGHYLAFAALFAGG